MSIGVLVRGGIEGIEERSYLLHPSSTHGTLVRERLRREQGEWRTLILLCLFVRIGWNGSRKRRNMYRTQEDIHHVATNS